MDGNDEYDLRVMIAHSLAGVFVAEKWVGWARQQVAAGNKTPELLELAAVEPANSCNWHDIENPGDFLLVHPALASLGYDVSNPTQLLERYVLTELTQLCLEKRQLWDVIRDFAMLLESGYVPNGFPDMIEYRDMEETLRRGEACRLDDLKQVEECARRVLNSKMRELQRSFGIIQQETLTDLGNVGDFRIP